MTEHRFMTVVGALEYIHTYIWMAAIDVINGPRPISELTEEDGVDFGMDSEELASYNEEERNRNLVQERHDAQAKWDAWAQILDTCGLPLNAPDTTRFFNPRKVQQRRDERLLDAIFEDTP